MRYRAGPNHAKLPQIAPSIADAIRRDLPVLRSSLEGVELPQLLPEKLR
jgi:hypothetical protein